MIAALRTATTTTARDRISTPPCAFAPPRHPSPFQPRDSTARPGFGSLATALPRALAADRRAPMSLRPRSGPESLRPALAEDGAEALPDLPPRPTPLPRLAVP